MMLPLKRMNLFIGLCTFFLLVNAPTESFAVKNPPHQQEVASSPSKKTVKSKRKKKKLGFFKKILVKWATKRIIKKVKKLKKKERKIKKKWVRISLKVLLWGAISTLLFLILGVIAWSNPHTFLGKFTDVFYTLLNTSLIVTGAALVMLLFIGIKALI